MKRILTTKFLVVFIIVLLIFGIGIYVIVGNKDIQLPPLKVGWQPPWINQGQIVEVLKHSEILKKNNLKVTFVPFTYGGPMTEAALAGSLDIFFSGDQPGITLISKDSNWKIIARMVNYRSAVLVPLNSSFKTLSDLKGKKIATAFGSTTHRDLIRELQNAGLDPQKDVQLINLDQAEHASVIASGGQDKWNGIDAIATYDPTIAISILKNKAKVLKQWISPSVVIAKDEVLKNRKSDVIQFLKSYIEACKSYSTNPSIYNNFYSAESRLQLPDSIYLQMALIEPNLTTTELSKIDISNDENREALLQKNADIAFSIGIIKNRINLKMYFDNSISSAATLNLK